MMSALLMVSRKKPVRIGNMPVSMTAIASSSFITAGNLRTACGLSAGTVKEPGTWLRFVMDNGTVLVVPKTQVTYGISGADLYNAQVVKGTKTVSIAGKNYKVRAIRCNPARAETLDGTADSNVDNSTIMGSEWYNLWNSVRSSRQSGYKGPQLAGFADTDLGSGGSGGIQYCYESLTGNSGQIIIAAPNMAAYTRGFSTGDSTRGWRPALELIR